jgi:hypothetical protein
MDSMKIMEAKGRVTTYLTFGFRCHPNYGNDLRQQYNQILSELTGADVLTSIVNQIQPELGSAYIDLGLNPADVLQANYSLS